MVRKLITKSVAVLALLCLVLGTVPVAGATTAATPVNHYRGGDVEITTNGTTKMLSTPGLTKNHTFQGTITVHTDGSGAQIQFVLGKDGTGGATKTNSSRYIYSRGGQTMYNLKGTTSVNNSTLASGSTVSIPWGSNTVTGGSEGKWTIDFKFVRVGQSVSYYLDGTLCKTTEIPADADAFTATNEQNLGFVNSNCTFTVSNIEVYSNESSNTEETGRINRYTGGSITQDKATETTRKMLEIPGLTKNFTLKGTVTLKDLGAQDYNGISLSLGNDGTNYTNIKLTRSWGTRYELNKVDKLSDKYTAGYTPLLDDGRTFTFALKRAGQSVTLSIDGIQYVSFELPEDLDCFDADCKTNLGFISNDCSYEVTDIKVYCDDLVAPSPSPSPSATASATPSATETGAATATASPTGSGSVGNVETGDASLFALAGIILVASVAVFVLARRKETN